MKHRIFLTTAFAVSICLVTIEVTASVLFFDDFESDTVGEIPSEWENFYWSDAGTNYTTNTYSSSGTQSLHVESLPLSQKAVIAPDTSYEGDSTLTFDFYLPSSSGDARLGGMAYMGVGTHFRYNSSTGSAEVFYNDSSQYPTLIGNISVEEWHTAKIDINWNASTYNLDIDGNTLNNISFTKNTAENSHLLAFGSNWPTGPRTVHFDDVLLYSADQETNPLYSSRISLWSLGYGVSQDISEFDPNAPTIVITHGWQRDADYSSYNWDFDNQDMPESQEAILNSIIAKHGGIDANILIFEWEGAYTGGDGIAERLINGSREARRNAEFAGVLLGQQLESILGSAYENDIHFIGHSFGTMVNGLATRYLEGLSYLDSAKDIQFTALDAPTDAPPGFAKDFDRDWFVNNLSGAVDYLDNYYGYFYEGIGDFFLAYGDDLDGAAINQKVFYTHTEMHDFYTSLIENGPNGDTNPGGDDVGDYAHLFNDWISPILNSYDSKPGLPFFQAPLDEWNAASGRYFNHALGQAIIVEEIESYNITYTFDGLLLAEQSPVSVYQLLNIPSNAEWLVFDWMVGAGGDGDWITVSFEGDLLWSMAIDQLIEGVLLDTILDISEYAGRTGNLFITLNSVGESNAQFYVGNFRYRGAEVPLPATMYLIIFGLIIIGRSRLSSS